mmetsp:Transcript_48670/g.126309  ORF Transcript_48670/g.126309 Transcript_48670/m.126309 type:complete len:300 (-) Transcript_48670:731-1630(-)
MAEMAERSVARSPELEWLKTSFSISTARASSFSSTPLSAFPRRELSWMRALDLPPAFSPSLPLSVHEDFFSVACTVPPKETPRRLLHLIVLSSIMIMSPTPLLVTPSPTFDAISLDSTVMELGGNSSTNISSSSVAATTPAPRLPCTRELHIHATEPRVKQQPPPTFAWISELYTAHFDASIRRRPTPLHPLTRQHTRRSWALFSPRTPSPLHPRIRLKRTSTLAAPLARTPPSISQSSMTTSEQPGRRTRTFESLLPLQIRSEQRRQRSQRAMEGHRSTPPCSGSPTSSMPAGRSTLP